MLTIACVLLYNMVTTVNTDLRFQQECILNVLTTKKQVFEVLNMLISLV